MFLKSSPSRVMPQCCLFSAMRSSYSFPDSRCADQASSGWRKNVANYGKWKRAVNARGGLNGGFYAGILKRASSGLAKFGYLSDDHTSSTSASPDNDASRSSSNPHQDAQQWNYGEAGAIHCAAVLEKPCPAAAAHQQKCLK